jgi:hypothetical protein
MLNCLVLGEKSAMTVVMVSKQNMKTWRSYRIDCGKVFRLKDHGPGDTGVIQNQRSMPPAHFRKASPPVDIQDKLYAQDHLAVLMLLQ